MNNLPDSVSPADFDEAAADRYGDDPLDHEPDDDRDPPLPDTDTSHIIKPSEK